MWALVLMVACQTDRDPAGALHVEGVVVTATVTTAPMGPPEAFAEPPPAVDDDEARHPDVEAAAEHFADAACLGRHDARDRFAADPEADWWWPEGCEPRPDLCAWYRERIAAGDDRDAILGGATRCDDALPSLMPWPRAVQWWAVHHPALLDGPQLDALEPILSRIGPDDPLWRRFAWALSEAPPTPQSGRLLVRLHDALPPEHQNEAARAMWRHVDPARRQQAAQACLDRPVDVADERCDPVRHDPFEDLALAVRVDPLPLVERARRDPTVRATIRGAFEACVRDKGVTDAQGSLLCASNLAHIDRRRAIAVLTELESTVIDHRDLLGALEAFDDSEAALAELKARGLAPEGCTLPDPAPLMVVDILGACGRAFVVGGPPATFLRTAATAVPALDEVVFRVLPPVEVRTADTDAVQVASTRWTMLAWSGSVRTRALMRDGMDPEQQVGFLNALAAAHEAPERFVLANGLLRQVAVVGEPEALAEAGRAGWLTVLLPED